MQELAEVNIHTYRQRRTEAVRRARLAHMSWDVIAEAVGVTRARLARDLKGGSGG